MNDLAIQNQDNGLVISAETASLIPSSIAPNTVLTYRNAMQKLES